MRCWTELRLLLDRSPDEELLCDHVSAWVTWAGPRLLAWHYFWEPDLWVRFAWSSADDASEGEAYLRSACAPLVASGVVRGLTFDRYDGDAEIYGAEAWPRVERDFTNGSELALALITEERAGTLSKERAFHWSRHVHTFSNQLLGGSWAEEARLMLRQARYRVWLLSRGAEGERAELETLLASLDDALARSERLGATESALQARWRAAGRPPMVELLRLGDDFDRDPGKRDEGKRDEG